LIEILQEKFDDTEGVIRRRGNQKKVIRRRGNQKKVIRRKG
jgi:hypothetical protein